MTDETESRRRALAFNAVGPAINNAGYWLPLSARRAVADAILAAVAAPDAGYCPHCGRGDCAPTADEYEQAQRRTIRIQILLDELRDRIRKLHIPSTELYYGVPACEGCEGSDPWTTPGYPCPTITALELPKDPSTPRHAIASAHEGDAATAPHGTCTCGHTITGDTAPARLEAHIADAIQEAPDA